MIKLPGAGSGTIVLCLSMLLAACSSPPVQRGDTGGIPRTVQDGAPAYFRDVSQIPDAVPAPHQGPFKASPYTVLGRNYVPMQDGRNYRETGLASWYGTKFHGQLTANGEQYDLYGMTAAHKTLPLPSYVRVTNLDNQRSIIVRVNDRGPFHSDRIIDLSYAGAVTLGFAERGTARVRVEGIDPVGWQSGPGFVAGAQLDGPCRRAGGRALPAAGGLLLGSGRRTAAQPGTGNGADAGVRQPGAGGYPDIAPGAAGSAGQP